MQLRVEFFDDEQIRGQVVSMVKSLLDGEVRQALKSMTGEAVSRKVAGASTPLIERVVREEVRVYINSRNFSELVRNVVADQVTSKLADALSEVAKRPRQ